MAEYVLLLLLYLLVLNLFLRGDCHWLLAETSKRAVYHQHHFVSLKEHLLPKKGELCIFGTAELEICSWSGMLCTGLGLESW